MTEFQEAPATLKPRIAQRLMSSVDQADGTVTAYFALSERAPHTKSGYEYDRFVESQRCELARALHAAFEGVHYIHTEPKLEKGLLTVNFVKDAGPAFRQFRSEYCSLKAAGTQPAGAGWLGKAMKATMDGMINHACAERGVYPGQWSANAAQGDCPPDGKGGRY